MDYPPLDLVAGIGKLIVEKQSISRDQKECIKSGIDCAAELAKCFGTYTKDAFSVMGLLPEQLRMVKSNAEKFGLTKVILFPCFINGVLGTYFKMDGGDITAFCNAIGILTIKESSVHAHDTELNIWMQQYGVVVYLSES